MHEEMKRQKRGGTDILGQSELSYLGRDRKVTWYSAFLKIFFGSLIRAKDMSS